MIYVSYSEGFKGGGWNSHFNAVLTPTQQDALQKFDQEEAQTIELGAKFDLANNSMRLNLAVFSSDYTNMQLTYRGPAPGRRGSLHHQRRRNEHQWRGSGIYVGCHRRSADRRKRGVVRRDDRHALQHPAGSAAAGPRRRQHPAVCPEWQTHLQMHTPGYAGSIEIKPRVDASFQPTTYFDATNTPEIAQLDDVLTVNASVVFSKGDDSPWSVTVGVNNLTDEGIVPLREIPR